MVGTSTYEFLVAGQLSPTAIAAFDELSISRQEGPVTVLRGTVRDQSHLYGLLARFQSLGLTVEGLTKLQNSRHR